MRDWQENTMRCSIASPTKMSLLKQLDSGFHLCMHLSGHHLMVCAKDICVNEAANFIPNLCPEHAK